MFVKEQYFEETSIGKYPKDWEVAVLGEVAKIKGGKRLPKGEKLADYDTGFPYIRVVDFSKGTVDKSNLKFLLPETRKTIKNYTISSNDVYISIAGTIGLAGVIPSELDGANLTENAAKICELQQVEKRFLAYLFDAEVMKKQIAGLMGKGTQPKLALFRIESLKFPSPSMEEQRAIVGVLGVVDCAIEYADRVVAKTERLKRGLMQELLTNGIGHKEYKQSEELGAKIPSEWKVERLDRLIEEGIITYHLDGNHGTLYPREEEFVDKGVPYIGANAILDGAIDFAKAKYVTEVRAKQFRKGIAKDGDVLFAHNATVGPVAVLRTHFPYAILSTSLTAYRCNQNVLSNEFLKYYMESPNFQAQFQCIMKQTTRNQVPITAQKDFYFVLPSLIEQRRIAGILSTSEAKISIEKKEKMKLERIKQGLMDLLLTGKVRIKVD